MRRYKKKQVAWQIQTDENGYRTFNPYGRYGSRYHMPDEKAHDRINSFYLPPVLLFNAFTTFMRLFNHIVYLSYGLTILVALLVYALVTHCFTRRWHVAQVRQPFFCSFRQTAFVAKWWTLWAVQLCSLAFLVFILHFCNIHYSSNVPAQLDNHLFAGYAFIAFAISTALIGIRNAGSYVPQPDTPLLSNRNSYFK